MSTGGAIGASIAADRADEDPADRPGSDRPAKLDRVRAVLRSRSADALVLTSPEMMTWLLDGARVQVPPNGPSVMAAVVTPQDETLVCANNEFSRMIAEELPGEVEPRTVPWFEPLDGRLPRPDGVAVLAESDVVGELRSARATLLPLELARYRRLCRDAATIVTDVVASARPEHAERTIAARLAAGLVGVGIEPLVTLVGGGRRLHHRHPLPTDEVVGNRFLAVVCGRRHGMITNLSRWRVLGRAPVGSDGAGTTTHETTHRLLEVEADVLDATRPGALLADVFAALCASYETHGFAADEWARHHQGGPTGYLGRDPKVTGTTGGVAAPGQAFAWNPTAGGAKVEDTVLTGSGPDDDVEILTVDPRWPTTGNRGRARPLPLFD